MDSEQFKIYGKQMIDYICEYLDTLSDRRVVPDVEPGYLRPLLPEDPPQKPEKWEDIIKDIDTKILPGVTNWQHPQFHAYFPSGNSFPSILADMLSDGIGCIGFSWAASPACTELETIVMDWFARALDLPDHFLHSAPGSIGGGAIESSSSHSIFTVMLSARKDALHHLATMNNEGETEENKYITNLVAYCSTQAHSCIHKGAMLTLTKLRMIETDENGSMLTDQLKKAIDEDLAAGLHPFFIAATIGTTTLCSFDNLKEIGQIAKKLPACWFHVDGAYAGNAFICPELRYLKEGLHYADSFNTDCNKWLLICYDCSCLWVKDHVKFTSALTVDPVYLHHNYSGRTIDFRHWSIALSRRFRSLKLWFTLRSYGIEGLQKYIRNHSRLAKYFKQLLLKDERFELCNRVKLGLVCFRLNGSNELNQVFLSNINNSGELHLTPGMFRDRFIIRFCVVHQHSTEEHIDKSWSIIQKYATQIM